MSLIVLRDVGHATPDGRVLFDHLDLSFGRERTGIVGRNGAGKSTLLAIAAGTLLPRTGSVDRNTRVGMLRSAPQPDGNMRLAQALGAAADLAVLTRLMAGDGTPDDVAVADWTLESRVQDALSAVGLSGVALDRPLASLSGGQRMRAALAALLLQAPEIILLDEPTNNLDRDGRALVARLLADWRQGAVVISHDRELLAQMDRIVEVSALGARAYGGGWSLYQARRQVERETAAARLESAECQADRIDREIRQAHERKARKDTAGHRARAKGGAPKLALDFSRERSERSDGRGAMQHERQREAAAATVAAAHAAVERLTTLTVKLPSTGLAAGRVVLAFSAVAIGHTAAAPLVTGLSFALKGPERMALCGPNGSGKTTLLQVAAGELAPLGGIVRRPAPAVLLDQQLALLDPARSILENFRRRNPDEPETACRTALGRFQFRTDAALQPVGSLSGGERLRAALACVLGGARPAELLLLDEPTNHLDLASIEAIEAGLISYDGALLVASHDENFLSAIGITRRLDLTARPVPA